MPGVVIPGFGSLLHDWRMKQGRSQVEWAFRLWIHGCGMSPLSIARSLDHAERTDEWLAADPLASLLKLMEATKRGLVRNLDDESHHQALANVIYPVVLSRLGG